MGSRIVMPTYKKSAMKSILKILVFGYLLFYGCAKEDEKKVADRTAESLLGNVSSGEIFPAYSKNEEIIAYRFYSFNKPFPDGENLIKTCKDFYENGDKDSQWGVGQYGHIMVSAIKDMDVIQSYKDAFVLYLKKSKFM